MPDDPVQAGAPRTRGDLRIYENNDLRVMWDATLCIHTGVCLRRSPTVFDVNARPWVDLDGADAQEIAATIRACPTGALRYDGPGVEPEQPDEPTTVEVRKNGPLIVRGDVRIQVAASDERRREFRLALCRCGASQNKPFCDNSHRSVGFDDAGYSAEGSPA
jgi:uncharacterized Fe-S cluster protein YjdI/CDGSH-type Zn-finger protein